VNTSFGLMPFLVDVRASVEELQRFNFLWDMGSDVRRLKGPHRETKDIWLRFRDMEKYRELWGDDMSHISDEHESVWQPASLFLSQTALLSCLIAQIVGLELGGVLLTLTPPGGKIYPHVDQGWHAKAHDKLYVPIQLGPGAEFCWEDGVMKAKVGEVWWFKNDRLHWVNNNSAIPRIGMIVCLRRQG